MVISEKVAYLKGLVDGLDIDTTKKEGRVIDGILEVLSDIASTIEHIETDIEEINEDLENVFDDVDELYGDYDYEEDDFFDEADHEHDHDHSCGCGCGGHHDDLEDLSALDGELYEVICPTCDEPNFFDEEILEQGSMKCQNCNEDLEFDTSLIDEEE